MDFDDLKRKYGSFFPPRFSVECGEGWIGILDRLFSDLAATLPVNIEFRIVQVKEKFAGLRVYHHAQPKLPDALQWNVYRFVALAEARSFCTCEHCGRPGRLWMRGGFFLTACDEHADLRGTNHRGRTAELVELNPFYERFQNEDEWDRYDPVLDDFVPCPPPPGFQGR